MAPVILLPFQLCLFGSFLLLEELDAGQGRFLFPSMYLGASLSLLHRTCFFTQRDTDYLAPWRTTFLRTIEPNPQCSQRKRASDSEEGQVLSFTATYFTGSPVLKLLKQNLVFGLKQKHGTVKICFVL